MLHRSNKGFDCLGGFHGPLVSLHIPYALTVALVLTASIFGRPVLAQVQPAAKFERYEDFMASARTAKAADFQASADSQVPDADEFEKVRQLVLKRYDGVTVSQSFIRDGAYYDCMPFEQQPAARKYGIKTMPVPPALPRPPKRLTADPAASAAPAGRATHQVAAAPFSGVDASGNTVHCPAAQVPSPRMTIEALSRRRASSRQNYSMRPPSQKPRGEADSNSISPHALNASGLQSDADVEPKYHYAYLRQYGRVTGFHQTFTVWEPILNQNAGQVQSIQQDWLVSADEKQTIEAGIIVKPIRYGDSMPHFFIFYTPNKYSLNVWDTDGDAFVVASTAPFVPGAAQQVGTTVDLSWVLGPAGGGWFLFSGPALIGYYPSSVFGVNDANGQMQPGPLASGADIVSVGGEVTSLKIPGKQTSFAQMGNGIHSNVPGSAYITDLYFVDLLGTAVVPNLGPTTTSPSCFSVSPTVPGVASFFFFGGPGGSPC